MENQHKPDEDIRIKATATIWGISVGMLGISIPLCAILHTIVIPLAVICGAAVSTIAVWGSGARSAQKSRDYVTQKQLQALEERLANLETINNFERRLAEEALSRQNNVPVGEIAKDEPTKSTSSSRQIAEGNSSL